jgi:hypothetical protein
VAGFLGSAKAGLGFIREFFRLVRANPSFRWLFAFRLYQALRKGSIGSRMLRPIISVWLGMLSRKYGINISNQAEICSGLYIGNYGGVCAITSFCLRFPDKFLPIREFDHRGLHPNASMAFVWRDVDPVRIQDQYLPVTEAGANPRWLINPM